MKKLSPSAKAIAAAMAAAGTAMLMVACGGSDDTPAEVDDPALVPQSAASSTTSWVNFAKALVSSDTSTPLELTKISELPVSDTEEPQALP
jgi:hypothetical protein